MVLQHQIFGEVCRAIDTSLSHREPLTSSSLKTYLLASGFLKHAAQLIGDLLVLRSVLPGVHGVAGLFIAVSNRDSYCRIYVSATRARSRLPSFQPSARLYRGPCRG